MHVLSRFLLTLLFLPLPLLAQSSGLRLVTSPLPISLVAEPGTSVSTELKVKNDGTEPETLRIDILKFRAYEDSGKPALEEMTPADDFARWVTFSEPSFSVLPGEWKTITATFRLPEEAAFGYYYAFVFTRENEGEGPRERETALVGGTATLVLLEARVPGAVRDMSIPEFSIDRTVYEFLPVRFTVRLKNAGNVHVAPRGNIFITQAGKDIALLELNAGKGNILPNSTRTFETEWADGFPVYVEAIEDGKVILNERGEQEFELRWNWKEASKLRFGKYHAKLLLAYDDGIRDVPIEGEVSFWVVPWRLVGAGLLNIVLIVGLIWYVIRLRRRLKSLQQKTYDHEPPQA
jgi:hypothetical protein